jgi:hypothetical protein
VDELDLQLSDVVVFELPSFEDAQAFRVRLRSRWPGWSHHDEQGWLFAAELGTSADGLPLLLREAQELLAELDLPAICFILDSRTYVLEPAASVYERPGKSRQAA